MVRNRAEEWHEPIRFNPLFSKLYPECELMLSTAISRSTIDTLDTTFISRMCLTSPPITDVRYNVYIYAKDANSGVELPLTMSECQIWPDPEGVKLDFLVRIAKAYFSIHDTSTRIELHVERHAHFYPRHVPYDDTRDSLDERADLWWTWREEKGYERREEFGNSRTSEDNINLAHVAGFGMRNVFAPKCAFRVLMQQLVPVNA